MMEADESGVPPRRVAGDVHTPASCSSEELMFRERHGGDLLIAMASSPHTSAFRAARPVSISMPASPTGFGGARPEVELQRHAMTDVPCMLPLPAPRPPMMPVAPQPDRVVFRSQPIAVPNGGAGLPQQGRNSQVHGDSSIRGGARRAAATATTTGRVRTRRDTSYDSFKTLSGKLERQITTHLRGVRQQPEQRDEEEEEPEENDAATGAAAAATETTAASAATSRRPYSSMPRVQRFFAALEGPELDKLRVHHEQLSPLVGGAGPAVRQDVAVPAPVPGVGVRHVHGHEQPGDPVEEDRHLGVDEVPAHHRQDQPGALVRLRGAHVRRVGAVRVQGRLLLRGRPARVLPPGPRQLLLRAVDRLPVPRHRRAAGGGGEPPALALVPAHGAARVPGAQDLRAVDLRRAAAVVEGGKPVEPPVHRRQLRRRAARRHHGAPGGPHLLLRRRPRPLHRAVRHAVPAPPHQRDAPARPPPRLLPLRRRPQRRLPRLGQDHRRVRLRLPHRLLHRHVPLRLAGGADQPVQGVQVLAGVVGVHVPDDERGDRVDPVLVGGEERVHAVAVHRAVRAGDAHRGRALPHHSAARRRAPRPLPQRHLHRHHGAQAQAHRRDPSRRRLQGPRGRRAAVVIVRQRPIDLVKGRDMSV